MTTFDSDAGIVAAFAQSKLDLQAATLSDEYFYKSLPLCVIDAVYSIAVSYDSTRLVVRRYCASTSQEWRRSGSALPLITEQESITEFCKRPEQQDFQNMAESVYQNRQRTSPRGGILKAEAVFKFSELLRVYEVDYFQDIYRIASNPDFEAKVKLIPGQKSGISLQYFWMLAGSDRFIKPDRMVIRFLNSALSRRVTAEEAPSLLIGAADALAMKFPNLSPRLLDYEVWKYQRAIVDA